MSVYLDDEDSAPLGDADVFELVGDSCLGHLRMSRSLEQISARGRVHHRRRTAVAAMAGVAAITVLGAAATFMRPSGGAHAVSTVGGASSAARMTDPDWTLAASAAGGYKVDITALGDVDQLNATLTSLGIEIEVVESAPSGGSYTCLASEGTTQTTGTSATGTGTATTSPSATDTATSTQTPPATASTSDPATVFTTATSPVIPTPTPVYFTVPGTPAAFTFGHLPKKSTISFLIAQGKNRPLLGTVSISEACLPVFNTQ